MSDPQDQLDEVTAERDPSDALEPRVAEAQEKALKRRPYPSHGEPYDSRIDWPERYTDGRTI